MLNYQSYYLDNGLKLIVHEDKTIPTAVFNVLYDVGARDEDSHKTGFAHLFEHLMFGGSKHIVDFDAELEKVGGTSNAFTNQDITNYYDVLPAENIETAFWLESDRMLQLSFKPETLEVQRKVVIEEFKQSYLNQPYGDLWLNFLPLCYKKHPYRWDTIGKDIRHIEQAHLEDVKTFFYRHYRPDNAIVVVAGNVNASKMLDLAQKWFGDIEPSDQNYRRNLSPEDSQTKKATLKLRRPVPSSLILKAYRTCKRLSEDYYPSELLANILGRGKGSLLYKSLVEEQKLFTHIGVFNTETIDEGLLVINGRLSQGVDFETAEAAIDSQLNQLDTKLTSKDLTKYQNHQLTDLIYRKYKLLDRSMDLAYFTLLGDTNLINTMSSKIEAVNLEQVRQLAHKIFKSHRANVLYYEAQA